MMAKIIKGKGFKGCINYILNKQKGTVLLDAQGVRLKSKESIIRSFVIQAKLNPDLAVTVGHISLNFSAQDRDKLSNEMIIKIAREYMQRMGIKDTQYILARHFDKEHPHVHLCFNRVDNMGKTISDRNDRRRSVDICKELTRKHGLYFSPGKENVKMDRLKEPDNTKYEIYHALSDLVPKCKDWSRLLSELKKQGIETKFKYKGKADEIQGVTFTKNGYSFTGSKIDRMFSYSKIDYQLKQNNLSRNMNNSLNQQSQQSQTNQSKGIIESALDAISGIGSIQPHGEDYEEEAFRNKMEYEEKKRQRKKKGIRR
ncbi:MAG: relaxase/mobilization nuclease domain-containing protein [Dysgonomonas sp.]